MISSLAADAQTNKDKAEQLAATFDKDKYKAKSKYGITKERALVTRHMVAEVPEPKFYSGRYVGIDGRYEITLTITNNGQIAGQLLEPVDKAQTHRITLSNIRIQNGLFTAQKGTETLEGVFINQGRVDNGQKRISLGLGITNPNLPDEGVNFARIFCEKK